MNTETKPAQHTPGPWTVGALYTSDSCDGFEADINAAGFGPAYAFGATKDQCEANARLIAAAPSLLTALRCQNHIGDPDGGFCNCPLADGHAPDTEHSSACAMARAAIRGATNGHA